MQMLRLSRLLILTSLMLSCIAAQAQEKVKKSSNNKTTTTASQEVKAIEHPEIKWISFSEAVELSKKEPKKMLIDIYTQWCGWCKVMDKSTYTDTAIINYVNKHYYAVKLDAEMKDTILFNNITFVNPNPTQPRSPHQLAQSMLSGKMSYPTTVLLDEDYHLLTQPMAGYLTAQQIEPILAFFGTGKFKDTQWEEFQKDFKGHAAPPPQQQTAPH
jgi:thioredoxin-related protein